MRDGARKLMQDIPVTKTDFDLDNLGHAKGAYIGSRKPASVPARHPEIDKHIAKGYRLDENNGRLAHTSYELPRY
jgi:hypothetical protein